MGQSLIERLIERRKAVSSGDPTGNVESRNTEAVQEELGSSEEIAGTTGADDNKQ